MSNAKKKILTRIAAAQRQADFAKKTAKLAKMALRQAKQKFKDAKRAAKKLRKAVKVFKTELVALSVKKPVRRAAPKKSAPKRVRPAKVAQPVMTAETAPMPAADIAPAAPAQ